jgi:hypothetical protein
MFVSNMFEKLMELGLKLSIPLSLFFLVIYIFHNIDLCIFFFFFNDGFVHCRKNWVEF